MKLIRTATPLSAPGAIHVVTAAPRYPGDPFGRLPHPVRPVREPLPTEPAPFVEA